MIDVYLLADDHRQNPIVQWGVFETVSRQKLGTVRKEGDLFRASTGFGDDQMCDTPVEARDTIARMMSPPARLN